MNTTNKFRIGMVGLASAIAGFVMQGCFAAQPAPECQVTTASAAFGITPYYVELKKIDGTGSCAGLDHMQVGLQRFRVPNSNDFKVGIKPSLLVDAVNGLYYSADSDESNNCSDGEGCDMCVPPPGMMGDNVCESVPDPVPRTDPMDPKGNNILGYGTMKQFPTDKKCAITDLSGMTQNFAAEMVDLVDGGTQNFPAVKMQVEFTDLNILNTTVIPGTAWTAKVKFTEGSCVANYDALAFWPEVHCETDADCNPEADLDAGRTLGSGINPNFKPKCDTKAGVCKPSVDLTTLK